MSFSILRKELSEKKFRDLYLLYGPEDFLIKKYLSIIQQNVVNKDFYNMNVTIMDGNFDLQKIFETCNTVPFFSEKRLIIVKKSGFFKTSKEKTKEKSKEKSKEKAKDKEKDELIHFLKNIPSHICIVFCEAEIDKRLKFIEVIKENGLVVEFEYQKSQDSFKVGRYGIERK